MMQLIGERVRIAVTPPVIAVTPITTRYSLAGSRKLE